MWQLKATRPSSQSSRKGATTSLEQSCPMTSKARCSLLCSYTSKPNVLSLPEQDTSFHRSPPAPAKRHQKMRRTKIHLLLPSGVDQSKAHALSVSARTKGLNSTAPCKSKGLLLDEEEKRARHAPRTSPERTRTLDVVRQTNDVPWVQKRPDAFPIGTFPQISHNFRANGAESHCDDKGWQRQTVKPNAKPCKDSPSIPTPSPMPPSGL